ncbi:MAG TPA: hypothetical protein VL026_04690 [Rhizomicrobium sp.]|nr:hypothetical protein [Rhizomicrobium sp.]
MGSELPANTAAAIDQWFIELQRLVKNLSVFSQNYPRGVCVLTEKSRNPLKHLERARRIERPTLTLATSDDDEDDLWYRPIWPDFP